MRGVALESSIYQEIINKIDCMNERARSGGSIAAYGAFLGISFLAPAAGMANAQGVLPKINIYEPRKETLEVCVRPGALPKTLREGCGYLESDIEARKRLLYRYLRSEAMMKRDLASAGGAALAEKLEKGGPISKIDREALSPYLSALRKEAAQINSYNAGIRKTEKEIMWYAESHYRGSNAGNAAEGKKVHAAAKKGSAPGNLSAVRYRWRQKSGNVPLDPRVVETCGSPAFYMLPAYVAGDCEELSAGLGKPSLVQYYNSRRSGMCTAYGFSSGITPAEKREFLAEKLDEYRHREISYAHAERLELEIVNFWRMGHANLRRGLRRCGSFTRYGELGVAAFVVLMIALVWRAKM